MDPVRARLRPDDPVRAQLNAGTNSAYSRNPRDARAVPARAATA
jgi:hypothetical protein